MSVSCETLFIHTDHMQQHNMKDRSSIKEDSWFEFYGNLVTKFEQQFEVNEKLRGEINRRIERYQNNETEYRYEIANLNRELRVRFGYEKNAEATNMAMMEMTRLHIEKEIEEYATKLRELDEEQQKEIARKYRSELAKTKKQIEEKKAKTGDEGADLKEREAELRNSLELITNIA